MPSPLLSVLLLASLLGAPPQPGPEPEPGLESSEAAAPAPELELERDPDTLHLPVVTEAGAYVRVPRPSDTTPPQRFSLLIWRTHPYELDALQPQLARLWLDVPTEWLPEPHVPQGTIVGFLMQPAARRFGPENQLSFGLLLGVARLRVDDSDRKFEAELLAMPRAVVIELRFDPLDPIWW